MRILLIITLLLIIALPAEASFIPDTEYKVAMLANAIRQAENSEKYPYGIKSIDTHGDAIYARKICINTIKNNVKRWKDSVKKGDKRDYLTFLWHRYCPPEAHGLNKFWLVNVKHFLSKEMEK